MICLDESDILEREKQIFESTPGIQPELNSKYTELLERQLKPEARKDVIEIFHKLKIKPSSMIDISDGLSSEIKHICKQSACGALIEEKLVTIHPVAMELALDFKINPITCALNGGEDYELLFTVDIKDHDKIKKCKDISVIGHITSQSEGMNLVLTGTEMLVALKAQGWDSLLKK